MITKKKLRVQIDSLAEENEHLLIDYEALSSDCMKANRRENQLLGENAELTLKQAHYLEILNKQNSELVRFNKEQTRLLNALQMKQNQLDQEITTRISAEEKGEALLRTCNSQIERIVTLLKALGSIRGKLAGLHLSIIRPGLVSIVDDLDRAIT